MSESQQQLRREVVWRAQDARLLRQGRLPAPTDALGCPQGRGGGEAACGRVVALEMSDGMGVVGAAVGRVGGRGRAGEHVLCVFSSDVTLAKPPHQLLLANLQSVTHAQVHRA